MTLPLIFQKNVNLDVWALLVCRNIFKGLGASGKLVEVPGSLEPDFDFF
jgi:hypothetical protein